MMIIRYLTIALVALSLTACSSKDDEMSSEPVVTNEQGMVGQGPLDGTEMYDGSSMGAVDGSVLPGSQQDLVVNVGDRVFFGYDRYDLSPEARAVLDKQIEWLKQYPSVNVTVEGHADERGTREYNLALGDRRASATKSYMISMGIDPRRINTISYGKERPAVTGSNPAGWAQNRRAVTRVE